MTPAVGVFCASSRRIDPDFLQVAKRMGTLIAGQGWTLVYGGGDIGMMGALARAVHAGSGEVVGVIPDRLRTIEGVAYEVADELIVTDTMSERKRLIYQRSDAFAVLPGGFGTLEEFLEVLTLKHLGYHAKPIALVNTGGFFDGLLQFFDDLARDRFSPRDRLSAYRVADSPEEALACLMEELGRPVRRRPVQE
jgi:uncharacterized protein (TIGR00730 family)